MRNKTTLIEVFKVPYNRRERMERMEISTAFEDAPDSEKELIFQLQQVNKKLEKLDKGLEKIYNRLE